MKLLIQLYFEFFKVGLFSVGGGMATLPFLKRIGETTGWYTYAELMDMLAVSESTPGAIGLNVATYAGYQTAGFCGAAVASLGEITPSILIILLIAKFLKSKQGNRYVQWVFYGLRPVSTGLIGAACVAVTLQVLTSLRFQNGGLLNVVYRQSEGIFKYPELALAVLLFAAVCCIPQTRNLHPVVFIIVSGIAGVVFHLA